MAREDVIIPQLEPAATDYNKDNLDRNFNDVSDTLERLRAALTVVADEAPGDLTDLENTVASLVEDVYDPVTGLGQTRARLLTEEGVRADADLALAARATTLEATVNDGTTGLVATRARLITEESTRASADSALASRATTLEATVNDGTTGLVATRARLITEESTRATADAALAARSTTLESSFRFPVPEAINKNPTFSTWTGGSNTYPEDWGDWSNGLTNSRETGSVSQYAFRQVKNTSFVDFGILQSLDGRLTQGWYVLEADITLNSGSLVGTGQYLHYGVAGITNGHQLSFSIEPDIDGVVHGAGSAGRRYRYSKLIQLINTANLAQLFTMTSWVTYGATLGQTKDVTWHKSLIRPATQGEIDAKIAKDTTIPNTIARIATEETTRAAADTALASRATTLEATVNDGTTGLVATRARLITEESTRATADAALASSITTLTAKTDGRPNLFPVPTPSPNQTPTQLGWQGSSLGTTNAPWVGGLIYYDVRSFGGSATTSTWFFDLPDTALISSTDQYTLSAYGYGGAAVSGDRLQMYIEVRDATNTSAIHISPFVVLNSDTERFSTTTAFTGGVTACRIRIVFRRDYPSSGSAQDTVFNMIKVEQGPNATAFTNSAQVNIQAGAIATLNSSAAFYQILVAASGGDPALIRLFSGLGGSEVAIAAKIISLINTSSGVAMPVMRATGGLAFFQRPISSDSAGRRVTIGPGYGVSGSEVVLWFGPSSIAPDDQSRTNGTFALGTDGQVYYGGTGLQTGSMQMELNTYVVNLTRLGTGTTSTSMTATGYAPGTLSYSWTLHSGDAVNIGSPSSATTNIGHTLTALGQTKTSVVKCTITSTAGPTTFRLLDISSSEIS